MGRDRFFRSRLGWAGKPKQLHLDAAGFTVTGTRHLANQDRYLIDVSRGVFVLADGMGGMRAGEKAAQMAIDLLPNHSALLALEGPSAEQMKETIQRTFIDVSAEIETLAKFDSRFHAMGTTAILAQKVDDKLHIGSLGDSRAYLIRHGSLRQYTIDHNMAQALVSMGAISRGAARTHRWRHMLWKYLGASDLAEGPDVSVIQLEPEDRILLLSDGVFGALEDDELLDLTEKASSADEASCSLVKTAVARGSRDDATCVSLFVKRD
jgi:serine/threonine protein phosphatase PrpC